MPRRSGGQKEQGILFAYRIRFLDFTKQVGAVLELRLELGAYLFADLVTAALNAGPNGRFQIARASAEAAMHFAHAFLDNALDCAPPSGMKDADGMSSGIHENHRKAVGGLDCQKQARS